MFDVPLPLYAQLRDELRARILDGRLKPHDKLPSEHELTVQHGVSRITVRQALNDLQKEGLIVKLHGKGAFVSHPKAAQSLNRLQGLSEALSLQGQTVSSKRLSMKKLAAPAAVARQLQLEPASEVYQLMTLRYLDREPLSVNCSYLPLPLGEKLAKADLSSRDLIDVFEHEFGLKVEQAQLEISARRVGARDARWLKVEPGDPVLQVERVLCTDNAQPLQTETAIYRADVFSYKLSLHR
ncbi:MAG: GntR family transcriptional regulator [Burkholderiaceae bacterium]